MGEQIKMDWQQVVLNGGPPCFAVNTPNDIPSHYCGRAERWQGHDGIHKYVSLNDLITTARAEGYASGYAAAREEAAKVVESFATDIHDEMTDGAEIAAAIRVLAATEETEGKEK